MTRIMNRYATLAVLVITGLLSACDNNKWTIPDLAGPIDNSRIRFFNFGVNAPSVKARLLALGATPIGSAPEEFAALIRSDYEKWGPIIKAAGIRGE